MKRQVVTSGPIHGKLTTDYRDHGPSHAVHHVKPGGNGHRPGTKTPGIKAGR